MTAAQNILIAAKGDMTEDLEGVRRLARAHRLYDPAATAKAAELGFSHDDDLLLFMDGSLLLLPDWAGTLDTVCPTLDRRAHERVDQARNLTYITRSGVWIVMDYGSIPQASGGTGRAVRTFYDLGGELVSTWPHTTEREGVPYITHPNGPHSPGWRRAEPE